MRTRAAATLLLFAVALAAHAEDAPDAKQRGRAYFDQAVAWVNHGAAGPAKVESFYCDLHDLQFDLDDRHMEGYLRVWFQAPDRFRQAFRQTRERTPKSIVTEKILAGNKLWIVDNGKVKRMHGQSGGPDAIAQLQSDRNRFHTLARLATLTPLGGDDATFEDLGDFDRKDGRFAGRWRKVRRVRAGSLTMDFYFARQQDGSVTYPGIVVAHGGKDTGRPTEAFFLSAWKDARPLRFPGKVEALRKPLDGDGEFERFLLAFPDTVEINQRVDPKRFEPPTAAERPR